MSHPLGYSPAWNPLLRNAILPQFNQINLFPDQGITFYLSFLCVLSSRCNLHHQVVDYVKHHEYTGDGWEVECDARHDIPAEVRRRGARVAMAWAADHCPRIRAAIDAERRRN